MSYRTGEAGLDGYLQQLEDRVRRLERGDQNQGTIGFSRATFGTDVQLAMTSLDPNARQALEVRRLSTGEVCVIDPGDCPGGGGSPATQSPGGVIFNLAGVVIAASSPLYVPPVTTPLTAFVATVTVSGSTPTVVVIRRNGTPVGTLTIPAAKNSSGVLAVTLSLTAGIDSLQYQVTSAGAGASDLVIAGA